MNNWDDEKTNELRKRLQILKRELLNDRRHVCLTVRLATIAHCNEAGGSKLPNGSFHPTLTGGYATLNSRDFAR